MSEIQVPRGTFDVLPAESAAYRLIEDLCVPVLERAGYERVSTPIFENTELFARGVGESTDIVSKEMYSFDDGGGRSVTLRPEGTAPICRTYVEHGMHKRQQPVRLFYSGPFFRHENPQAGRFRQFHQLGAEALGSDSPALDAESILVLAEVLEVFGCGDVVLRLASLGSPERRVLYREALVAHLEQNRALLSEDVVKRIDSNPLRAFDSSDPGTVSVMESAPQLLDWLDEGDLDHFTEVREHLDRAGIAYEVDPTLVRGLDYYTRTVFEFTSAKLGAQSGVGGGGRYDGLVELLGGPATPGIGWAAGIERMILASDNSQVDEAEGCVLVVALDRENSYEATVLAADLRGAGLHARSEVTGRSVKAAFKHADRIGAGFVVILGPDGHSLKEMSTGEQSDYDTVDEVKQAIRRLRAGDQ